MKDPDSYSKDNLSELLGPAAEVLRASEARFRSIFNNAPIMIDSFSTDGELLLWNPELEKKLGWSKEEAQKVDILALTYPDPDKCREVKETIGLADGVFREYTPTAKDGSLHTQLWANFPLPNGNIICVGIDITGQKLAEEKLVENLLAQGDLIEKASAGFCVCHNVSEEPYVRFTHWNPLMTQITGYTMEEINQSGWYQAMYPDPDVRQRVVERMTRMRVGDDLRAEEWVITTKEGKKRPVSISTSVISEQGGKTHVLAIMQDMSERREVEEALRESEERLKLALRGADLGLWDYNLQTGEAFISQRRAEILGYSVDELEPHMNSWRSRVHPDDLQRVVEAFKAHAKGETPFYECEHRLRHKSGEYIWVLARAKIVERDATGKPVRLTGTSLDITDRKRTEEALRKAKDELEIRVKERTAELNTMNEKLLREIAEREKAEKDLKETLSLLHSTIESTADGILVVDLMGKIGVFNKKFTEMWHIPESVIESRSDDKALRFVLDQLKYPEDFLRRVRDLYGQPDTESFDVLELEDGRILERYSRPQRQREKIVGRVWSFRDVTKRKQAEVALEESERRLRALFEQAAVGVAVIDSRTGQFARINQRYCDIVGYTKEEMGKLIFQDITHPEDVETDLKNMELLRQGKITESSVEKRYYHKNGETVWVNLAISPLWTFGEEPNYHIAVVQDITERKWAQEALQESEERYRVLVENLNEGIFVVKDGVIKFVNPRSVEFTGYSVDDLTSGSFLKFVHPDDREMVLQRHMSRMAGDDTPNAYTARIVARDGSVKWLLLMSRTISWQEERAALVSATDITERKAGEDALRESEEKIRTLINAVPDIICFKDGKGRWLEANDSDLRLFELEGVPYQGKKDSDLAEYSNFYRDAFLTCEETDEKAWAAGKISRGDEVIPLPDGSSKVLDTIKVPLFHPDGSRKGLVVVGRDITQQRAAEEFLRQSERFRAVADLASGVAHNFNNLLQIVIGNLELALMDLEMGNYTDIRDSLKKVLESSRFGTETVRRLQSFAGIRDQSQVSEKGAFDLSDIVKQALEMSKAWWKTIPEKQGRKVSLDMHLQDGCLVQCEKNELFEVVVNLVKNATEALTEDGAIDVKTLVRGSQVVFRVRDTGVGISKKNLKRIFNPFFTTKASAGSGLGLASSRKIIEDCGGSILVESSEGKGTTFTIRLPLAEQPSVETRPSIEQVSGPGMTILVIDDMEAVSDVLKAGLTRSDHVVVTASSGQQGLDIFNENPIDLVICDLGMPGLNGWEVGKRITSICEERHIPKTPFILLTGWGGQKAEAEKISESGVDAVFEKPINIGNIREAVRQLCEREPSQVSQ